MPEVKKSDTAITQKKPASTALAKYDGEPFAITQINADLLREVFEANMGGEKLGQFDLERITVPSGGGLAWTVPDPIKGPQPVQELVGVILTSGNRRAYWKKKFAESGGGSPPDCSSMDAITGFGVIGEDTEPKERKCDACPMAEYGSKDPTNTDDQQQACTQRKLVFFMRPEDRLPLCIDLPPTSVSIVRDLGVKLTFKVPGDPIPFYGAVVALKLKEATSQAGITYSELDEIRPLAKLNEEDSRAMKAYHDQFQPVFNQTGVSD
jgi:hypothetical protein